APTVGGVDTIAVDRDGRRGGGGRGEIEGRRAVPPPEELAGDGESGGLAATLAPFPVPPFFILKPRVSRADSESDSRLGTDGNQLSRGASRRGGGRRRPSHFRSSWTVRPSMPPPTTTSCPVTWPERVSEASTTTCAATSSGCATLRSAIVRVTARTCSGSTCPRVIGVSVQPGATALTRPRGAILPISFLTPSSTPPPIPAFSAA